MVRRLPSQPPVLPGFSHIHILGSGGFADVFLYEQNMPRRQVAVKVMLSAVVNDQVRQMFQAEANLMAQLSPHPSILTVYQASVSSDGRPYLVMEMCSSSLSERYRRERIPVPEVLRIAVKIGSAIETAHRAGVLHRDIKPSNILLTAYGHPVLSDFGIAATLSEATSQETVAMSIPWTAPEVLLDETPGTVASEVFSLAATVYSLLVGRSPFELPGAANKSADLIARIGQAKVQPVGRPDVPASLERLLQKSMSRNPANRPSSVLELVRELQGVETELALTQTPIEVAMDDWALATVANLEDRTSVRGVPGAVAPVGKRRRRSSVQGSGYAPIGTLHRQPEAGASSFSRPPTQSNGIRLLTWSLLASAVLVLALGATATAVLIGSGSEPIPTVSNIEAVQTGDSIEFAWPDPGIDAEDSYQITTSDGQSSIQRAPAFAASADVGDSVCIVVSVNRSGTTGPPSKQKCLVFSG